jgi:hypothetical protein
MSQRLLKKRQQACMMGKLCFLCSHPLGDPPYHKTRYNKVGKVCICGTCSNLVDVITREGIKIRTYDHNGSITIVDEGTQEVLIKGKKVVW